MLVETKEIAGTTKEYKNSKHCLKSKSVCEIGKCRSKPDPKLQENQVPISD